jgi:hypothetical protein
LQFNRILGYTDEGVMRSHIFMNARITMCMC